MNALKVLIIVAALAIFGCAGVERKCVDEALADYDKYLRRAEKDVGPGSGYPSDELEWVKGHETLQMCRSIKRCVE